MCLIGIILGYLLVATYVYKLIKKYWKWTLKFKRNINKEIIIKMLVHIPLHLFFVISCNYTNTLLYMYIYHTVRYIHTVKIFFSSNLNNSTWCLSSNQIKYISFAISRYIFYCSFLKKCNNMPAVVIDMLHKLI